MTDGDVYSLREGKNGLFYDRKGDIWDASVFKIIENPISIRQAFWTPYRKLGRFIEKSIEKNASEKDEKVTGDMTTQVASSGEKKQMFDIGKFAGIFAAIGLAVTGLTLALTKIVDKMSEFHAWQWIVLVLVILLLISGPAMILAWLKLRKRSLSPLLNANGWAINAAAKVNITFGSTLTEVSDAPRVAEPDPYADKTPWWKKLLGWLIVLGILFWIAYSTNLIEKITKNEKWHYEKVDKSKKEETGPAEESESLLIMTRQDFYA